MRVMRLVQPSPILIVMILIVMMQIILANEEESISLSISEDDTAFIIYGSEWSPIFITSHIKGNIEQTRFRNLRIQIDNEWQRYAFIGFMSLKLQFQLITTPSLSKTDIIHITKHDFIEKCKHKQVAFDVDNRFIVPKKTFPFLFHSKEGSDIIWNQQQFAQQCNDGNIAQKNMFGIKKPMIGGAITRHPVRLQVLNDGFIRIYKLADDSTGNVWEIVVVPQGKHYFELRDDRGKWKQYQFLGAFEFKNGDYKIIITNVGVKGVDKDREHVFIWSKQEFIDECHAKNIGFISDEWQRGIDLVGITKKKKEINKKERVKVKVSMRNRKMNVFGVMKRGWEEIEESNTIYVKGNNNKWMLYRFMGEITESEGETQNAYESYDDNYYYDHVSDGKLMRLIRSS